MNYSDITIVTTCKNRIDFLIQTISTWKKWCSKIIVVDWDSSRYVSEFIDDKDIRIIRVEDQKYFYPTRARNVGGRVADNKYIFFVDSDIILKDLSDITLDEINFYRGGLEGLEITTSGTCLVSKKAFEDVGGYSELITFESGEDGEFYRRLELKGYKHLYFNSGSMEHIPHGYELRKVHRPVMGPVPYV